MKKLLLEARLLRLKAEIAEMNAENYQRKLLGQSIAYDDFSGIENAIDDLILEIQEEIRA